MDPARLDIRLKPDTKELIQQAAELRNQSLTQVIVTTLAAEAGKVIAEHRQTTLSDRDRDLFLALLDSPPVPNRALSKAAKKHSRR